jgi:hypothetical protein
MNPMIDFNMILGSVTEIEQGADGAWKFLLRVGVAAIFSFGAYKLTKESKVAHRRKLHQKSQCRQWILHLAGRDTAAHGASTMKTLLVVFCLWPLALFGQPLSKELQTRVDSAERMKVIAAQEQERLRNLKPRTQEQIRASIPGLEASGIIAKQPPSQVIIPEYVRKMDTLQIEPDTTDPLPGKLLPANYSLNLKLADPTIPEHQTKTDQQIEDEQMKAGTTAEKNFFAACDVASAYAAACAEKDPRPEIQQVYSECSKTMRALHQEGKITWKQLVQFNKQFYRYVANIYNPPPPAPDPSIPPQLPTMRIRTSAEWTQLYSRTASSRYNLFLEGVWTLDEYNQWSNTVHATMIMQYGKSPPPSPSIQDMRHNMLMQAIEENTQAIERHRFR